MEKRSRRYNIKIYRSTAFFQHVFVVVPALIQRLLQRDRREKRRNTTEWVESRDLPKQKNDLRKYFWRTILHIQTRILNLDNDQHQVCTVHYTCSSKGNKDLLSLKCTTYTLLIRHEEQEKRRTSRQRWWSVKQCKNIIIQKDLLLSQ